MMVTSENLIKQLNETYFELLTDAPWFTYERTIQQVVSHIALITEMPYVSIVMQKNWSNTSGFIVEEYSPATSESFRDICTRQITEISKKMNAEMSEELLESEFEFFLEFDKNKKGIFHMIPLVISNITRGYLMCIHEEKQYTPSFIKQFKRNTEQLLKTTQWINDKRQMNGKNEFLFDLTSELYTSTDQTYILKETIASLEFVYPNFTYTLLLSQDHNADKSLPIQMIEYSGNSTKRVSSDVFMSGNARMERGEHGESYLYTPLNGKQGIYGVLQLNIDDGIHLPQEEIQFIKLFSNVIGESLENAILYENSRHRASELKLINEVTHKLNSNLKLSEIISIIKSQITNICTPTHIGFVYHTHEASNKETQIDVLKGSTPYFHKKSGKMFIEEMLRIADVEREALFKVNYESVATTQPFKSVMSIPMFHAGEVMGLIIIGHENSSAFSFKSFKIMKALIQNATLALTNSILKNKLEQAVVTDYLTKLYSRSYLDEKVALHMEADSQGAMVLFDVDDFKRINDSYGHHIGDEVLIQIADILRENTRENDVVSRWGGEELALYLPHASIKEGVRLARRIRKKVERGTKPKVTLSSGVSSWSLMTHHNIDTLFTEADKSLYQAKEQGKNQVVYKGEVIRPKQNRQLHS